MGDLDRARAECKALLPLYRAAVARLSELAPGMAPGEAFSTGSAVAHNRRVAGIPPSALAMAGVSDDDKGDAAGAFGGPRVEAALVGVAVPMAVLDLNSAHAGSFSVLRLTPYLIASTIEFEDARDEFLALLDSPDLTERLLDPATAAAWGPTLVSIESSDGAAFPATVDWTSTRHGGTVASLFFPDGMAYPVFWFHAALAKARGGEFTIGRVRRPVAGTPVSGLKRYRLFDGSTVDFRRECLGLAWRRARDRIGGPAKLGGNVDTYGLGARYDRKAFDREIALAAKGIHGEALWTRTRRPEYPAEFTSLLLSGAVAGFTSFVVGLTELLLSSLGGVLAHVSTDSIAVPCSSESGLTPMPGGSSSLPDGQPAIKRLTPAELLDVTSKLDPLMGYGGHPAWKEVASTLTDPTWGVIFGSNKLVLARQDETGAWQLVQSSDADMGGHVMDPTGTGARTADGRWQWAADLELCLFKAALSTPVDRRIAVPDDLPEFADALDLSERQAMTWKELVQLRRATGDPTILPLARYVQVKTGGRSASPVALGHHPDPAIWVSRDFRLHGKPVCIDVLGPDGVPRFAAGDPNARRHVIGHTIRDHAAGWLREHDPSMTGPARGLRRPTAVRTDRSLVHYVGRSVEDLDAVAHPVLEFEATEGWGQLRRRARVIGAAEIARLSGMSRRTASDVLFEHAEPGPETMAPIADAVALAVPRICPVCGAMFYGPPSKETCSTRCRVRRWRDRRRASITESVEALRATGGAVPADRTWEERAPRWVGWEVRRSEGRPKIDDW
jgi:hypothetical protein